MNRYQKIGCSLVLILAFIIGSAAPAAAREPRHKERSAGSYQNYHNNKKAAARVPSHQKKQLRKAHYARAKHVPVVVKGHRYFFSNGGFYRKGLSGYIAVQAPLGAFIVSLPIGSHSVVVGGTRYHVYGGVYYRQEPRGYEVVKKPYLGDSYCSTDKYYDVPEKVMVIPRILNVRKGPGKRHPVVHKVYRDDILKIISRANGWVFVHLPYGKFGWVMTEYVTPTGPSAKG